MNELRCEVIRDLMPLVADDLASPESKKLVEEHTANCEACKSYYEGMIAQIERAPAPETDTLFIRLCKKTQKGFRLQKLLLWLLIVAVAAMVLGGFGWRAYHNIFTDKTAMPLEWYDARLYQGQDGQILVEFEIEEGRRWYGETAAYYSTEGYYYIEPLMPVWPLGQYEEYDTVVETGDLTLHDGRLVYVENQYEVAYDPTTATYTDRWIPTYFNIKGVRLGDEQNYVDLYRPGDPIPQVSK